MDHLTKTARSENMRAVKGKNSKPELIVRKKLHSMGYRYRLHRQDLPGKPDIVLPKYRLCIFVHGCFWHRHPDCPRSSTPKTNYEFWQKKFNQNMENDKKVQKNLENKGWQTAVIWECEIKSPEKLESVLQKIFHHLSTDR